MGDKKNLIEASFLRNAYFGYGTQGLKIALGFAWVIALTSTAGIEMYGMIALLTSLSGLVGNLLSFRTNEAVVRFYKRGELEDSPGLCRLALGAGLLLDIVVATLLFTVVRYYANDIATEFLKDPQAATGVTAYSWIILATFLRGTGIGLLTALERFRTIYSLAVAEQLLRLVILFAVLEFGISLTVDIVVWVIFSPAIAVTSFTFLLPLLKMHRNFSSCAIPAGELKNYLKFSFATFASSSLKAGNRNIDTMILGYLTSPASVGVYSLFRRFLSPLMSVVSPIYQQIYPRFVKAVGEEDSESIRFTITQANRVLSRWSALLVVAIALVAASYWWYMDFGFDAESALTFLLLAASSMVQQRLWWTRPFALAHNPNISIWANALSALLVTSLVFVFTWYFGLIGAAIGVIGNSVVMSFFWRSTIHRYS